jgi:hypothetical protein
MTTGPVLALQYAASNTMTTLTPLCCWRLREELRTLIERFGAAAHECVPAAAQYSTDWPPEDLER